jgi:hypothetical protein
MEVRNSNTLPTCGDFHGACDGISPLVAQFEHAAKFVLEF